MRHDAGDQSVNLERKCNKTRLFVARFKRFSAEIATDDIMNEPVEKNKLCRIGTIIPVRQNVNTFTNNGGSYEEESYGST